MSEYIGINGQQIEIRSADPANPTLGQIWYNTTSSQLKGYKFVQSWATGGNLGTARRSLAGAGTQTAGLAFGGFIPPTTTATEEYDGSTWTAGGNLGTARQLLAGAGTQTAGLGFGGYKSAPPNRVSNLTEEYDGTSWTAGGNLNTARRILAGAGTQTVGLAFGGRNAPTDSPPGAAVANTEEYDGSTWTVGGNLGTARYGLAGCGTQTAGLAFGGIQTFPTVLTSTEEYDGTSWTAGGSLNTGRSNLAGAGTQTAGLAAGGDPTGSGSEGGASEAYNGTSWSIVGSLNTARRYLAGAGTQPAGLAFGGGPPESNATEEYSEGNATVTFTTTA